MSKILLDAVPKSPHDTRNYQLLELNNGLQVLLVSDSNAFHCAASMAINVGHFQDPVEAQGLAHFLEHMLFMGTQAHPDPNIFPNFIGQYGGHHNAWTGTEHTNFYFDIRPQQFDHALQLFSRLFVCPLFSDEWIDKELRSVEAEYRMKLTDELRRLYQVHKETANPKHPFTKFSVGNVETLAGDNQTSIRQHLINFFTRWYCTSNMRLVLTGPVDLALLADLAVSHFSDLPATGSQPAPITEPLYLDDQMGVVIHVRPIKNACRMILTIPMPGIDHDYPYKTTTLFAHILGYEGPGSLCSQLKELGFATDLSAGGGINGSNFKDFNFNIQLTELGLQHYEEVCQMIFTTVQQLSQIDLEHPHYAERQQMVGLSFRYQESIRSIDLASQLSINMLHYQAEHIITGDYLMERFNQHKAQQLLQLIRPERARIVLIHHSLPVNQTTQLYETAYSIKALTPAQLTQLQTKHPARGVLPDVNPYIPKRLDPMALREPTTTLPTLLASVPALQLWHLQDAQFRVPKGHIFLSLVLPQATSNRFAFAHARVWCELVLDKLSEKCYDAEVAGIHFNLYPQQSGISIHISGFSERQPELLAVILNELTDFNFSAQRFAIIRHQLHTNWLAVNRNKPINHLFTILNQQLQRGCFVAKDLADELTEMSAASFTQNMPIIFERMNVVSLVHGDWPVDVARRLGDLITRELNLKRRPQQAPLREVRILEPGKTERIDCQLPHPDHAVAYFCQGQALNDVEKAYFLLLNHLVSPGFFAELRTEQQLGYMVGNSYVPMNGRPGLLFYVQSPHASLATMEQAISQFLRAFCRQLHEIPAELWQDAKRSVIQQLTDHDPNLRVRSQRLWTSIGIDDLKFDLAQRMANQVANMQLDKLVSIAQNRLLDQAAAMWLTCSPEDTD